MKIRKRYIVIGSIVLLLIVTRLMLPYFVIRSVNKILSDIPGYTGSISDVDIRLLRGAYVIKDLKLFKVEGIKKIPLIDIPTTDLSIEWPALLKGALVGEIILKNPVLNFVGGDQEDAAGKTTNQTGMDVDWTIPIKRLMPLQINRLQIEHGSIFFYDFTTKPKVTLHFKQLQLQATNLSNADKQNTALPSKITATAISIGEGKLIIAMDINIIQKIPDLDLNLKFEGIDLPALNDFFLAYSKIDIEKGTFNLYAELKIDKGKLTGYAKPIMQGIQIVTWKEDKQHPLNLVWQSIVGFFVNVFTNQRQDQFATKIPIEGDLNDVKLGVWPSLTNIFKNAFIKAFDLRTDDSIEFSTRKVLVPKQESRKQKRQRHRKERKNERSAN